MAKRWHVLVVDDNPDLRQVARLTIEAEVEARVTEASSGPDAIETCRADHVDVIVLDMHMPGQDGLQVLHLLNNLSSRPSVIAWSADEIALRRASQMGADGSVSKTDLERLTESVRQCLRRAGPNRLTRPRRPSRSA